MILIWLLVALCAGARGAPDSQYSLRGSGAVETHNIIQVPSNCPSGYKPDATGTCRPIWYLAKSPYNIITVPPNCPPGQKPDPNGHCRPEWFRRAYLPANIITVPPNCPPGQKPDPNGHCREEWFALEGAVETFAPAPSVASNGRPVFVPGVTGERNIFQVRPSCRKGYSLNSEGICKKQF